MVYSPGFFLMGAAVFFFGSDGSRLWNNDVNKNVGAHEIRAKNTDCLVIKQGREISHQIAGLAAFGLELSTSNEISPNYTLFPPTWEQNKADERGAWEKSIALLGRLPSQISHELMPAGFIFLSHAPVSQSRWQISLARAFSSSHAFECDASSGFCCGFHDRCE